MIAQVAVSADTDLLTGNAVIPNGRQLTAYGWRVNLLTSRFWNDRTEHFGARNETAQNGCLTQCSWTEVCSPACQHWIFARNMGEKHKNIKVSNESMTIHMVLSIMLSEDNLGIGYSDRKMQTQQYAGIPLVVNKKQQGNSYNQKNTQYWIWPGGGNLGGRSTTELLDSVFLTLLYPASCSLLWQSTQKAGKELAIMT